MPACLPLFVPHRNATQLERSEERKHASSLITVNSWAIITKSFNYSFIRSLPSLLTLTCDLRMAKLKPASAELFIRIQTGSGVAMPCHAMLWEWTSGGEGEEVRFGDIINTRRTLNDSGLASPHHSKISRHVIWTFAVFAGPKEIKNADINEQSSSWFVSTDRLKYPCCFVLFRTPSPL